MKIKKIMLGLILCSSFFVGSAKASGLNDLIWYMNMAIMATFSGGDSGGPCPVKGCGDPRPQPAPAPLPPNDLEPNPDPFPMPTPTPPS